jgi:hypothetical protein
MSAIEISAEGVLDHLIRLDTTLLDLVHVLSQSIEHEIVATVSELLRSGRVRLTGNFRDVLNPIH